MPHTNTVISRWLKRSPFEYDDRGPESAIKSLITTAMAPAAPEIMPSLPPITAVMNPRKNVEYKPTKGGTPATKENATDSGTCITATVMPLSTSFLNDSGLFL